MKKVDPKKVLVAIPTYNEQENIVSICRDVLSVLPEADVVVIDDASLDGTGALVIDLGHHESRLRLISRSGKLGVGSAHQAALTEATRIGADVLVTLDADHTHRAADIPRLLDALENSHVAVGSRFAPGGGLEDWTLMRRSLTNLGHLATQILLQIPYDSSGAFRAYRVGNVTQNLNSVILSDGYTWFYESLTILHRRGLKIVEVPIILSARAYGSSKMRPSDVLFGILNLFLFGLSANRLVRKMECDLDVN